MSRPFAALIRLADHRHKHKTLYFNRAELNLLLGLYSRHVARGEWRDYAIDHREGVAIFSVFRHTHESPLFSIVKSAPAGARPGEFHVFSGRQRLKTSKTLADALDYFQKKLWLASSGA
jgi:hypothetical protein